MNAETLALFDRYQQEARARLREAVRGGNTSSIRAARDAYAEIVLAVEQAVEDDRREWAGQLRAWFASPHAEARQ